MRSLRDMPNSCQHAPKVSIVTLALASKTEGPEFAAPLGGDRREDIFVDAVDRQDLLKTLELSKPSKVAQHCRMSRWLFVV
jgi:hypothetical protein